MSHGLPLVPGPILRCTGPTPAIISDLVPCSRPSLHSTIACRHRTARRPCLQMVRGCRHRGSDTRGSPEPALRGMRMSAAAALVVIFLVQASAAGTQRLQACRSQPDAVRWAVPAASWCAVQYATRQMRGMITILAEVSRRAGHEDACDLRTVALCAGRAGCSACDDRPAAAGGRRPYSSGCPLPVTHCSQ